MVVTSKITGHHQDYLKSPYQLILLSIALKNVADNVIIELLLSFFEKLLSMDSGE